MPAHFKAYSLQAIQVDGDYGLQDDSNRLPSDAAEANPNQFAHALVRTRQAEHRGLAVCFVHCALPRFFKVVRTRILADMQS